MYNLSKWSKRLKFTFGDIKVQMDFRRLGLRVA